jgi:PAT family beta-lactamase induction signal transducer AmpG
LFLRERKGDQLIRWPRSTRAPEAGSVIDTNKSIVETLLQLKSAFSQRSSILAGALAICSLATTSAFLVFWPVHMLRQLGWTSEAYLTLEGRYAILFGLLGSLLGGLVASWLGAKRSVIAALASLTLCWLFYAATVAMWDNKNLVTALFVTVTFLAGVFQVSMFALFMGVCSPVVAATQFSAYMALLNVSSGFGSKFAGYVGERKELTNVFLGLACLQLVMIPIVSLINLPKETSIDVLPETPNRT